MYEAPISAKYFIINIIIDVFMQVTNCSFYWTCTVTHNSICVCSKIEKWASGPLLEVKKNRKVQITSVETGRDRSLEAPTLVI